MPLQRRTIFAAAIAGALVVGFAANQATSTYQGEESSGNSATGAQSNPGTQPTASANAFHDADPTPTPTRSEPADRGNASREPEVKSPEIPQCISDDKQAFHDDLDEWALTFMDHEYGLDANYAPTDLVRVTEAGVEGVGYLRELVISDLAEMASAAKQAGAPIAVHSSYRSYGEQKSTYKRWSEQMGSDKAALSSAREGHSEHQLGTALDIRGAERWQAPWKDGDFGQTKAGKWLAENARSYGFIMSFPPESQDVTCYKYEPWHFRYVGKDVARQVQEQGVTLREFLWAKAHSE